MIFRPEQDSLVSFYTGFNLPRVLTVLFNGNELLDFGKLLGVGAVVLSEAGQSANQERDVDDAVIWGKDAFPRVWKLLERVLALYFLLRHWCLVSSEELDIPNKTRTPAEGHAQLLQIRYRPHECS